MKAISWHYECHPSAGLLHFSEPEDEQYVKDYWCLLYGYAEPPEGLRVWPRVSDASVAQEEHEIFPYTKSRAL